MTTDNGHPRLLGVVGVVGVVGTRLKKALLRDSCSYRT